MAPPRKACPDRDHWQQFRWGLKEEAELEHLAHHLEHCPACLALLSTLDDKDVLVTALRTPVSDEPPALPEMLDALICKLKNLLHNSTLSTPPGEAGGGFPIVVPATSSAPAPRRFGRYEILRPLGAGGMGTVYLARDPQLSRTVALKVPQFHGPDDVQARARQRFLREARAAAAVRHPHVCPIHDVGEQDGEPFVIMAYIEGRSLADRLKQESRFADCREAAALVAQVAEALAVVHAHGIIHRDLKPGNILLDQNGQALLTDFGLARVQEDAEPLTADGTILGTPAYMAPEQVDAALGPVTPRSDVYSLGVVLYSLLTGQPPFSGSLSQLLHQVSHQTPPPPSQFRPDLDPALEAVVLKAMARRPEDRYAGAREMAVALHGWRGGARQPTTTPDPEATTQSYHSASTLPARSAWRRSWTVAAALLLVAILGSGYWFFTPANIKNPADEEAPTSPAAGAFKGWIDVRVWSQAGPQRRNLGLADDGALPLRAHDQIRVEAELDRPAYLYVLWIDPEGQVAPVFPWTAGKWNTRPAVEQPRARLSLPEDATRGWTMKGEQNGMETVLLLACAAPLQLADDELKTLLAGLPPQRPVQDARAAVWFENGVVVQHEEKRMPNFFAEEKINDPVLRLQGLLRGKLQPYCAYGRAVSFANQGK